jgi:hypothetical protein
LPQAEQLVVVSTRSRVTDPPEAGRDARLALHALHRLGSFLKFLSAKNNCSPAVHTNSAPQSTHFSVLSWNSIVLPLTNSTPSGTATRKARRSPPLLDFAA